MSKIYTIIVTYNAENFIEKCINSLFLNGIPEERIIIVDNASKDQTLKILEEKFGQTHLIRNRTNLGFGAANNIGIKYCLNNGGSYFFLLNQDVYLKENTFNNLLLLAAKNPDYGILSPMHLNRFENGLDNNFYRFISGQKNYWNNLYMKTEQKQIYNVAFINAACWLVSKRCINEIGGFDPLFFHYGEDEDYCNRTIQKGFKVGFVPSTQIIHDRPTANKLSLYKACDQMYISTLVKIKKCYRGSFSKIVFKIVLENLFEGTLRLILCDFRGFSNNILLVGKILSNIKMIDTSIRNSKYPMAFLQGGSKR